jgi:hypothetical protein
MLACGKGQADSKADWLESSYERCLLRAPTLTITRSWTIRDPKRERPPTAIPRDAKEGVLAVSDSLPKFSAHKVSPNLKCL